MQQKILDFATTRVQPTTKQILLALTNALIQCLLVTMFLVVGVGLILALG